MSALRFTTESIVWQEVPGEVSLAFQFSGCPLRCPGCHSADTWRAQLGTPLTPEYLGARLAQYRGLITCVLFLGGEWQPDVLLARLQQVRAAGLATCLYTGLEREELPPELLTSLDYLKTGRWIAARGGLDSPDTNQRLVDLRSGDVLNALFLKPLPPATTAHRRLAP
ncbi:MAG: anaerobic ribonucleoside-triphosphate reductase activating protein [Cardiobacteriaceae bacterium]|nr:anaerobic ribonucleoside-triphosphate reductase activating protein [Cardiobacteriaceae bacterium]